MRPALAGDSALSGRVVDAAGGPVPFAVVTARSLTHAGSLELAADADGAFRAQVPRGPLELVARAEAFSSALRRVQAPANGVLLELGPSSQIVGSVVAADTRAPLPGVSVSISPEPPLNDGHAAPRERSSSGSSGANGEFAIGGLRGGGSYRVTLLDPGWEGDVRAVPLDVAGTSTRVVLEARRAASLKARVLLDDAPCTEGLVRLAAAREWSTPLDGDGVAHFVSLPRGHYDVAVFCAQALPYHAELELAGPEAHEFAVSGGLSVSGRVLDASGAPLPQARVAVRSRNDAMDTPGALCTSDERGEFICGGLTPGEHECQVVEPLDADAAVVPVVLERASVRDVVLPVRPLGSVRVALDGSAAERAESRVLLRGPTAFPIQARRVGDEFVFERLPLASYEVYVEQPSAGGGPTKVELTEAGQVVSLELRAPPRAAITGVVVDEAGTPLGDQWIAARAADPLALSPRESDPQALSDVDGAFSVVAVSGGVYDLFIESNTGRAEVYGVTAGASDVVLRVVPPSAVLADRALTHAP